MTAADYLVAEERSEIRHEYLAGTIVAMSGATDRHNIISGNIFAALRAHLRGSPCRTFIHDMKVRIPAFGEEWVFYYPDIFVACNPTDNNPYYRTEPKLILEVLSPATEHKDRIEKFFAYQRLASLEEYVLVDPDRGVGRAVSSFRKDDWGRLHTPESDAIELRSVGLMLRLDDVYEGV